MIIVMIHDMLAGSVDKLYDKLNYEAKMSYLHRDPRGFDISPEEMVTRLQTFINSEASRPVSPVNPPVLGTPRMKAAGAVLVERALTATSHFLHKGHEKLSRDLLRLGEELETLKAEMKVDNDYRDACITAWRANGGHWGELEV
jgi:hypothetical protein